MAKPALTGILFSKNLSKVKLKSITLTVSINSGKSLIFAADPFGLNAQIEISG